jgi:hypothetical protein
MGSPIIQPGDPDWVISTMMAGRDVNGHFRNIRIDDDGDMAQLTRTHMEVHQSNYWSAATRLDGIANDAAVYFLVVPAAKTMHSLLSVTVGGNSWVDVFLDPTISNDGTEIPAIAHNRNDIVAATGKAYHTPTVGGTGTVAQKFLIQGGRQQSAVGGGIRSGDEIIFSPGTKSLIRVTNKAGAGVNISIGFTIEWYEEAVS